MEWFKNVVPMKEAHKLYNTKYLAMVDAYVMQVEEADVGKDWLDSYATTEILDAKYENADPHKVVKNQTYITNNAKICAKCFNHAKYCLIGNYGVYPHKQIISSRSQVVPHVHLKTVEKEL